MELGTTCSAALAAYQERLAFALYKVEATVPEGYGPGDELAQHLEMLFSKGEALVCIQKPYAFPCVDIALQGSDATGGH